MRSFVLCFTHPSVYPTGRVRCRLLAAALSLAAVPGQPAARDWLEVKSPNFVVVSDAGETRARRVATELEQIRALFTRLTSLRLEQRRPLLAFAVRGEDAIRELAPWYWERRGRVRPAGLYLNRSDRDYILLRTDLDSHAYSTVYRDYVRRLTDTSEVSVPTWLVEGLGGFFETVVAEGPNVVVGGISDENLRQLRGRKRIPLATLLAADRRSPEYTDTALLFHAQATILAHYLLLGPDLAEGDELGSLTRVLREGLEASPAGHGAVGDVRALDKALRAYTDGRVFRSRTLPLQPLEAPLMVRPLSAGEAAALQGHLLVAQREPEARAVLDDAFRLEPQLSIVHEGMGRLSLSRGRSEEAAQHLKRALELEPQNAYLYLLLASAASWRSDAHEAALRRALELAPASGVAMERLADVLWLRKEKLDEAESLARRALEHEPRSASRRTTLAEVLRRVGRVEDALAIENELRREALRDPEVLAELANHHARDGRWEDASALAAEALTVDSKNTVALDIKGVILVREKRFDEAESAYRQALKLRPRHRGYMNRLGYLNADRNVRVTEALSLIDRALAGEPSNYAYLDSRGWALFRLGRLPEAEAILQRALEQREGPDVLEHLGEVRHARGAPGEARALWRRAIERDDVTDEAKERLTKRVLASEDAEKSSGHAP